MTQRGKQALVALGVVAIVCVAVRGGHGGDGAGM
jgi:hypothetical protein